MADRVTVEKFEPRELGKKEWGVELLVAHVPDKFTAKVSWMDAGKTGPLQSHRAKDESFYLLSGTAKLEYLDASGALQMVEVRQGDAYHIPPGAVHRFEAVTPCIIVEGSTPHFDDRVSYVPA